MKASTLFLFIALAGAVLPLKVFFSWLVAHGVHPVLFWQHLTATPLSVFAWLDVFISAVALLVYLYVAKTRFSRAQIISVILATCLIGVSCGLPLLLSYQCRQYENKIQQPLGPWP